MIFYRKGDTSDMLWYSNSSQIKPFLSLIAIFLILFLMFSFISCGGGSSASTVARAGPGQALLGPLCGATVELFEAHNIKNAIHTAMTDDSLDLTQGGTFDLPVSELDDSQLYVVAISGGDDIDADDDGIIDDEATENLGTVRLVATGSQLRLGNFKVNILTELVYHQVVSLLLTQKDSQMIVDEMDRCARLLLSEDLNGNGRIEHSDLFVWDPVAQKDQLLRGWDLLSSGIEAVHMNRGLADFTETLFSGIVGVIEVSRDSHGVAIANGYAYMGDGESELRVVDLSNSGSPIIVGTVNTKGWVMNVAVSGNYAYATTYWGLRVIDITASDNPILVGFMEFSGTTFDGFGLSGDYAYIGTGDSGFSVVDVSDPSTPVVVGSMDLPGRADRILIAENYAYVTSGYSGMYVIDITNPNAPARVGAIDTPGFASGFALSGKFAYVADDEFVATPDDDIGLQIIDVSDPTNPAIVGVVELPIRISDVDILGDKAYVTDGYSNIWVLDISEPGNPLLVGIMDTPQSVYGLILSEDYSLMKHSINDDGNYRYEHFIIDLQNMPQHL